MQLMYQMIYYSLVDFCNKKVQDEDDSAHSSRFKQIKILYRAWSEIWILFEKLSPHKVCIH